MMSRESADAQSSDRINDGSRNGGFPTFENLLGAVRRQIWIVVICGFIGAVVGVVYAISATPLFTASMFLIIDKSQPNPLDNQAAVGSLAENESQLLSQVQLLQSSRLAAYVVDKLDLARNKDFMEGNPSAFSPIVGGVRSLVPDFQAIEELRPAFGTEDWSINDAIDDARDRAIGILQRNLTVARVGQTYIMKISYTSDDPKLASRIANAYGDAYFDDQLEANFEATRRASSWLQARIDELRQQAFDADLAVQTFRNENGLVSSGDQLVSQQRLGEIATSLVTAQAETAEAKARLDQIRAMVESGNANAVVGDALESRTINNLRADYLDAARRETEISSKLGDQHAQAVRLRAEMQNYQRLMFEELKRIAESYESTYTVALNRQEALEDRLGEAVGINEGDNTSSVELRQLEREADTLKSLYDSFLQQYQESIQQQSIPITDARVITEASPPEVPIFPKKTLVVALFATIGLSLGSGLASMREMRDQFFRSGNQASDELGLEFLGYLPLVSAKGSEIESAGGPYGGLWAPNAIAAHTRRHPMSSFTESLRSVKVASDIAMPDRSSKVIGMISCLPSEGKSTLSTNFGLMLAMQGVKTLIIDGDMRNPGLTRALETKPEQGFVEAVTGNASPFDLLKWDNSGSLAILPTILKRWVPHSSDLLTGPSMTGLIETFRREFKYIIVDLPPIGALVDARAFAPKVDAFILVVESGRTSRRAVRNLLARNPEIREKCLGVVLNKWDEAKMKRYQTHGSEEFYMPQYAAYYHQ